MMEDQSHQYVPPTQPSAPQPVSSSVGINQTAPDKPKLNITDSEAQAILTMNNLASGQQRQKSKPPLKLLIVVAVLIALVIAASFLIGAYKSGGNPASDHGLGIPNQSNPTTSNGVSNQINQDVKSCSNPLNATLVC